MPWPPKASATWPPHASSILPIPENAVGIIKFVCPTQLCPLSLLLSHKICDKCYPPFSSLVGMCGAASYRRGLVITFLVMSIHAIIIFVPTVIIVSSFDIHFFQVILLPSNYDTECNFSMNVGVNVTGTCWLLVCQPIADVKFFVENTLMIIWECEQQTRGTENKLATIFRTMTRLGTDYRLDAGLITAAIIELGLAIASTVICTKTICGSGKVRADSTSFWPFPWFSCWWSLIVPWEQRHPAMRNVRRAGPPGRSRGCAGFTVADGLAFHFCHNCL